MNFINKNYKWISLGSNILAFISLFLPFASVSADVFGIGISKSINFIDGDGLIVLFALLAACGLLFIRKNKFALIPLVICLFITIYDAINIGKETKDVVNLYNDIIKVSLGIGFYLLLLSLIVSIGSLVYANFIMKRVNKSGNNIEINPETQMNNQQPNYHQVVNEPQNQMSFQSSEAINQLNIQPADQMNQMLNEQKEKFCSSCGAKQSFNSQFCKFCGNKLN